ncbi:hypothetical protein D9M69_593340 [compost metagenome]
MVGVPAPWWSVDYRRTWRACASCWLNRHDLVEQCRTHPRFTARLIRSHPSWSPPEPPAIERRDAEQPQHVPHNTATASPEWRLALTKASTILCSTATSHTATGRYCATGAELRPQYDQIALESEPCQPITTTFCQACVTKRKVEIAG